MKTQAQKYEDTSTNDECRDRYSLRLRDAKYHNQGVSVFFGTNGPEPLTDAVQGCCDQLDIEILGYGDSSNGMEWALVVKDDDFNRSAKLAKALDGYLGGDSDETDEAEAIFSELGIQADLLLPNSND